MTTPVNMDVFLEIIKKSNLEEIKKVCESNRTFNRFCKENEDYIYSKLIQRDFPGRKEETPKQKYFRLLSFSKNYHNRHSDDDEDEDDQPLPSVDPLAEWYAGIDQSYQLLKYQTYQNPRLLDKVLSTKPNVNVTSKEEKMTPLMFAKTEDAIDKLIKLGADVNAKNEDGLTALHYTRKPDIITKLVKAGADINAIDNMGITPLNILIEEQREPGVLTLINLGANVDMKTTNGDTPLHFAIQNNASQVVLDKLLEAGADVNAKNKTGDTPLHLSLNETREPSIETIQTLINAGANVNIQNNKGETPLEWAVGHENSREIVNRLLQAGADPKIANNKGRTPLHILNLSLEMVNTLLEAGADVNAKDYKGKTPLDYTKKYATPEVIQLLTSRGAVSGKEL